MMRQRPLPGSSLQPSLSEAKDDSERKRRFPSFTRPSRRIVLTTLVCFVLGRFLASSRLRSVSPDTRHVLLAVSGNNTGLFQELQVSLKSLLLNAPLDYALDIHIMADEAGTQGLQNMLDEMQLHAWKSRQPTVLTIYNVEAKQAAWTETVQRRLAKATAITNSTDMVFRHSIGTYYRLFAGEVLPATTKSLPLLYMDTDVVILANLQTLWNIRWDDTILFQWGLQCAGFLLYYPHQVETLWHLWDQVPRATLEQLLTPWPAVDDQLVLKAIQTTYPHVAGSLPLEWDISAMDGPWKFKPNVLLQHRPQASMLHYNGGGQAGQEDGAFFERHRHYQKHALWRISEYYVRLPWSWARHMAASMIPAGSEGNEIRIEFLTLAAATKRDLRRAGV